MRNERTWLKHLGSGCLLNLVLTGLLVGIFRALADGSADVIVFPFLLGATASFGLSLYLARQSEVGMTVVRKVFLVGGGVVLGSILAVFGIAGFLLLAGS